MIFKIKGKEKNKTISELCFTSRIKATKRFITRITEIKYHATKYSCAHLKQKGKQLNLFLFLTLLMVFSNFVERLKSGCARGRLERRAFSALLSRSTFCPLFLAPSTRRRLSTQTIVNAYFYVRPNEDDHRLRSVLTFIYFGMRFRI